MKLWTEYGYPVYWERTGDGQSFVAGYMDPIQAIKTIEDATIEGDGFIWVTADPNVITLVRAIRASNIAQAAMVSGAEDVSPLGSSYGPSSSHSPSADGGSSHGS